MPLQSGLAHQLIFKHNQNFMNTSKLPADPLALILGIVALVLGFAGCCCYGIIAIVPLIIAIIGLISANKSLKEYGQNPEAYDPRSKSNVSTGKILNIIAIVFNGIVVFIFIGILVFYGTMWSSGAFDEFRNYGDYDDYNDDPIFEVEEDTLYSEPEIYDEETIDTTNTVELKKTFEEG